MDLVLGLGNPGARYAHTRHNVGWRVVETLAARWHAADGEREPERWRTWCARRGERAVTLMEPLAYMNRSGEALASWTSAHGAPDALLVVSDDVYLPLGALRLRAGGSSGGHRGLESIERALGSAGFARLRIGVGAATSGAELGDHVLEEFEDEETAVAEEAEATAAAAVTCWFDEGLTAAMNRFNRRMQKEEPTS